MKIIEIAKAGNVIDDAPTFSQIGWGIMNVLLQTFGIVVIIGIVVTSIIYFTAGGNEDRIKLAKKSFFYCILGIIVGLGAKIILNQIGNFLG